MCIFQNFHWLNTLEYRQIELFLTLTWMNCCKQNYDHLKRHKVHQALDNVEWSNLPPSPIQPDVGIKAFIFLYHFDFNFSLANLIQGFQAESLN